MIRTVDCKHMGDLMVSFILGAGAGLFVYLKGGRSIGYGNPKSVWTVTLITFIAAWAFIFTFMKFTLHK